MRKTNKINKTPKSAGNQTQRTITSFFAKASPIPQPALANSTAAAKSTARSTSSTDSPNPSSSNSNTNHPNHLTSSANKQPPKTPSESASKSQSENQKSSRSNVLSEFDIGSFSSPTNSHQAVPQSQPSFFQSAEEGPSSSIHMDMDEDEAPLVKVCCL
jgi:hypothetical protein